MTTLNTSPVVRNDGKLNPTIDRVRQRMEQQLLNFRSADATTKLRIMMACCLPHDSAAEADAQRVIDTVVDNADAIRVYDWPLVTKD